MRAAGQTLRQLESMADLDFNLSHSNRLGTLMHSSRDWLDAGGRMLARRLDQLHTSLDALGDRVRCAVAEAVAESLGGWIHDAFLAALDQFAGWPSEPEPRLLPRRWEEPGQMIEHNDSRKGAIWPDSFESKDEPERSDERPTPPAQPPSDRLALSLTAGLQAAAWCLRRSDPRRPLLSIVCIALFVGLAVLAAPLLTVALRLTDSASQLEALTEAVGFNRSLRAAFDSA
jgi:hypothetical protein